jgi:hypothetical protein
VTAIPTGRCQCGCGRLTAYSSRYRWPVGATVGRFSPYARGCGYFTDLETPHYQVSSFDSRYIRVKVRRNGRTVVIGEHVAVVEKAIGHQLPKGAEVHHINGDVSDNRPQNLVACDSHAYHLLLHRRQHTRKVPA